jgi:hypothetical protein
MPTKIKNIYQFKIVLKDSDPKIWRRIQVPENYSFYKLHCAIQDAMGWEDYHMHMFEMKDPMTGLKLRIETPFEDDFGGMFASRSNPIDEAKAKISQYFTLTNKKASYEYDFGDGWEHEITLEKILPVEENIKYPKCIAGERACPPEDCGGVWGYEELLEIRNDPKHEYYEERMEWLGEEFDPEKFDPAKVKFR